MICKGRIGIMWSKFNSERESMAKIFCPHCHEPVAIRTSQQITNTTREIYTNCDNEKCLARPVFTLSHSHDTQPPISKIMEPAQIAINFLDSLPEDQKQKVFASYEFLRRSA